MGIAGSGFWNVLAKRYARQPIADEAAYRRKLEETRQYLTPESDVLEFGCGTGSTAILHAPFVHSIRCIDFSERMIEIARERAAEAGADNVTFEVANILDLDVPDGSFDVVMGMSILHLLNKRHAVIAKVLGMLKPGGVFVSSTVCLGDGMKALRPLFSVGGRLRILPTVNWFSEAELKAELESAGFVIERFWCPGPNKASFIVARKPA